MSFDPGLINTGWGVLEKNNNSEKYIDHGCITTSKNEQLGKRLNLIYNKTLNLLRKYSPNAIAVEKIFANKNPESTMKLGKARAVIEGNGMREAVEETKRIRTLSYRKEEPKG